MRLCLVFAVQEERLKMPKVHLGLILASTLFFGGFLAWTILSGSQAFSIDGLSQLGNSIWSQPGGPFLLIGAVVLASLLFVPQNLLTFSVAVFLNPFPAIVTTYVGAVMSATLSYWLAHHLGREKVQRFFGPRLTTTLSHPLIAHAGLSTLTLMRFVPIAPYTVFNLAAGAFGISARNFFGSTLIALIPGKVGIALFGNELRNFSISPSPRSLTVLIVYGAVIAGALLGIGKMYKRLMRERKGEAKP